MHDPLIPALIVAHGQPSNPAPAAAELDMLAQAVAAQAGGRAVGAATFAQEGALAAALARLGPQGLVLPLFMAGGWFARIALTDKLRTAGATTGPLGWQVLEPFGCDPLVFALARDLLTQALIGQDLSRAEVVIAAHGSFKSSAPSDVAHALAAQLKQGLGLARAEAAFIDQNPRLADVAGFGFNAVCLPFFAARGSHVTEDIPHALAKAGFGGHILAPVGLDARVPAIIAAALARATPVCAQTCRYSAPHG